MIAPVCFTYTYFQASKDTFPNKTESDYKFDVV